MWIHLASVGTIVVHSWVKKDMVQPTEFTVSSGASIVYPNPSNGVTITSGYFIFKYDVSQLEMEVSSYAELSVPMATLAAGSGSNQFKIFCVSADGSTPDNDFLYQYKAPRSTPNTLLFRFHNPPVQSDGRVHVYLGFDGAADGSVQAVLSAVPSFDVSSSPSIDTSGAFRVPRLPAVGFSVSGGDTYYSFPYQGEGMTRANDALAKAHGLGFRLLRTWTLPEINLLHAIRTFNNSQPSGPEHKLYIELGCGLSGANIGSMESLLDQAHGYAMQFPDIVKILSVANEQMTWSTQKMTYSELVEAVSYLRGKGMPQGCLITCAFGASLQLNPGSHQGYHMLNFLHVAKHLDYASLNLYSLHQNRNLSNYLPQSQIDYLESVYNSYLVWNGVTHAMYTNTLPGGSNVAKYGASTAGSIHRVANPNTRLHFSVSECGWQSTGYNATTTNLTAFNEFYNLYRAASNNASQFMPQVHAMYLFNLSDEAWKGGDNHWGVFEQGDMQGLGQSKLEVMPPAASSSGDPHVFPLFGDPFEIPSHRPGTYMMFHDKPRNITIMATTRWVSPSESNAIETYAKQRGIKNAVSNGVFYDTITIDTPEGKGVYCFDTPWKMTWSGVHALPMSCSEARLGDANHIEKGERVIQHKIEIRNGVFLYLNHFLHNPSMRYGLGMGWEDGTTPSMLAKEAACNTIQGLLIAKPRNAKKAGKHEKVKGVSRSVFVK